LVGFDTRKNSVASSQTDQSIEVVIATPWERPPRTRTKQRTVSAEGARRLYEESPYTSIPVGEAIESELLAVLSNNVFGREASRIFRASSSAERELGALAIYERDGTYNVYSVRTPDPEISNRMRVAPVDSSLGRHVFDWHPHPWGNTQPSPADLGASANRGVPGVIRHGRRGTANTIFQGGCKEGAGC
jgi:hypothetical protein